MVCAAGDDIVGCRSPLLMSRILVALSVTRPITATVTIEVDMMTTAIVTRRRISQRGHQGQQ